MAEIEGTKTVSNPQRILLLGMMGCGKTTVGHSLSALSGWPYLDNDTLLRQATGKGPDELALELGADGLHALEIRQLLSATEGASATILGGAAAVVEDTRIAPVLQECFVVYLRARVETLAQRVGCGKGRPWLTGDKLAVINSLLERRGPLWEESCDLTVDVDHTFPEALAQEIWTAYNSRQIR